MVGIRAEVTVVALRNLSRSVETAGKRAFYEADRYFQPGAKEQVSAETKRREAVGSYSAL